MKYQQTFQSLRRRFLSRSCGGISNIQLTIATHLYHLCISFSWVFFCCWVNYRSPMNLSMNEACNASKANMDFNFFFFLEKCTFSWISEQENFMGIYQKNIHFCRWCLFEWLKEHRITEIFMIISSNLAVHKIFHCANIGVVFA